jgi:hypothetical protein
MLPAQCQSRTVRGSLVLLVVKQYARAEGCRGIGGPSINLSTLG